MNRLINLILVTAVILPVGPISSLLLKKTRAVYFFPPLFVLFEEIRGNMPFGGFNWLLTGQTMSKYVIFCQMADIALPLVIKQ